MRILLINPYGTLPSDDWREYRTSRLLRSLLSMNHDALWITTNYDSRQNKYRTNSYNSSIRLVKAGGFSKNISLKRLLFEWRYFASVFLHILKSEKYDVINIVSPCMVYGLILASVQKIRGGKVTFDVLDLWPEHFYTFLSKKQRWFFFPLILFLRLERSISFYLADLIFFCSEEYSYEAGSFLQSAKKRVRYIGTDFNDSIDDIKNQKKTNRVCRFLYAGTFGESYDVQSLIQAIMLLIDEGLDFEVHFAGDGPLRNDIVELAKNYPKYVRFVGLLGPDSLFEELLMADVGLCCYAKNSRVSMPLKFFDYVANQIYVLNSLTGEINDWLNDLELGMSYEAGNISSLKTAMTEIIHGELWLKVDWKTKRELLYRFDASNETDKMANEIVEL